MASSSVLGSEMYMSLDWLDFYLRHIGHGLYFLAVFQRLVIIPQLYPKFLQNSPFSSHTIKDMSFHYISSCDSQLATHSGNCITFSAALILTPTMHHAIMSICI